MPKVEAPVALIHDGAEMVLRVYLDRANAEIERVTAQRDALARWVRKEAIWTNGAHDALTQLGLDANTYGTVTEIDHG